VVLPTPQRVCGIANDTECAINDVESGSVGITNYEEGGSWENVKMKGRGREDGRGGRGRGDSVYGCFHCPRYWARTGYVHLLSSCLFRGEEDHMRSFLGKHKRCSFLLRVFLEVL
jgi:hypothetical protein